MANFVGDVKDLKIGKRVRIFSKKDGVVSVAPIKRFGIKR
jgi:hypothetical protein